jgi:alcohol dehydrogenase (NADP+)
MYCCTPFANACVYYMTVMPREVPRGEACEILNISTMSNAKGYAALAAAQSLVPFAFERRAPGDRDVVIDIRFCGICHSDIHQVREEWGGAIFPMVPGHEIAGIVSGVGGQVTRYKPGDRVGVGCFVDSCRACGPCRAGLEQYCLEGMTLTYNSYERDGHTPTFGGYSDHIVVNEDYVVRIPDALPLDVAAPLLCAGITLYSPLMHWKVGPGKNVAIAGLGGLGHIGVKIAHALGADVTILSRSLSKQADGRRLGADRFMATADPETFKQLAGSLDLIVNTISAEIDWNQYLGMLKLDGALVVVGVPEKQMPVGPFALIGARRSLAGSMIGGIQETQDMLNFCAAHNIACDIEKIPIQAVNQAYHRVVRGDVRYRFVIDMESAKSI